MQERFIKGREPKTKRLLPLPKHNEREFERSIAQEITKSLQETDHDTDTPNVKMTRRSADGGRDIIVNGVYRSQFLGFKLPPSTEKRILVECKYTANSRLRLQDVAANFIQISQKPNQFFLLVTNSTLTPRSLSVLQEHCCQYGATFLLIDSFNFFDHFNADNYAESNLNIDSFRDKHKTKTSEQISYQVLPDPERRRQYFVHFLIRTFGSPQQDYRFRLHSTVNWAVAQSSNESVSTSGHDAQTVVFRLRPNKTHLPRTARFSLDHGKKPQIFEISLTASTGPLVLPRFESQMTRVLDRYLRAFERNDPPHLVNIHAPSGTGKTRFLEEVSNRARALDWKFIFCRFGEGGEMTIIDRGNDWNRVIKQTRARSLSPETVRRLIYEGDANVPKLILFDNAHLACRTAVKKLEEFSFRPAASTNIVVSGRSDPPFRNPIYEEFIRLQATLKSTGQIQYIQFDALDAQEIIDALRRLFPKEPEFALDVLHRHTSLRAIDLSHYIFSLVERGYATWLDEDELQLSRRRDATLRDEVETRGIEESFLERRYEHLASIQVGDITLEKVFEVLALLDDQSTTAMVVRRLLDEFDVPASLMDMWFLRDRSGRVVDFSHDTLKEFLLGKAYSFGQKRNFSAILDVFPEVSRQLDVRTRTVIDLQNLDLAAARPELIKIARQLRSVGNISSLDIDSRMYNPIWCLVFYIMQSGKRLPLVLTKALITRGYLNMHIRPIAEGLLDNLRLLAIAADSKHPVYCELSSAALNELIAHGLLNGGDIPSALALMHRVEQQLSTARATRLTFAVEFDLCDRLQAYYTQVSAFEVARGFFLRGRTCAHRTGDEQLMNVSLSAEFHLYRYLDCEDALRLACVQLQHARRYATRRSLLHAELNVVVASWTLNGLRADEATLRTIDNVLTTSRRESFGHLIPRAELLRAVQSFFMWQNGEAGVEEVSRRIGSVRMAGLQFGYNEYAWLADMLELLSMIERGVAANMIVPKACEILGTLKQAGLTFVAEGSLCFQNPVVISNCLRAIYEYADEQRAFVESDGVAFSPMVCPDEKSRRAWLVRTFLGGLICNHYDDRALKRTSTGYPIVLV